MNPNGTPKNLRSFQPGESGNPGGKPVGARNRINAKFLEALEKDFEEGGEEAIRRCRVEDPSAYVRALLGLQPKELKVEETSAVDALTDEQLDEMLTLLRQHTKSEAQPVQ